MLSQNFHVFSKMYLLRRRRVKKIDKEFLTKIIFQNDYFTRIP